MRPLLYFTRRRRHTARDDAGKPASHGPLPALLLLLRCGCIPSKQPIQAYVERVRNIAQPVKRQVDGRIGKIAAGIRRKACALRYLLGREASGPAGIHEPLRELRYVRHLLRRQIK